MTTHSTNDYPLVADLDGTLINTDLLYEGFILLCKKNPLYVFPCFIWLLRGRAYLKRRILSMVNLPAELLPYNEEVLAMLQNEAANGRRLILATASPVQNAREIAKTHPIFETVYGTEERLNLKGERKLELLVREFGHSKFDYIGDSIADLKIFGAARYSYLVNPSSSVEAKAKKIGSVKQVWRSKKNPVKDYFKAIRVYQWVKNLLVFVPLMTSHTFNSTELVIKSIAAFFAFSFAASAGYLINDLLDLNADRSHPRKKFRPMAAGRISIPTALSLALVLLITGFVIASRLNLLFSLVLAFYFLASLSYSIFLKRIVLYDVFVLATLYSTRLIAGGLATGIILSFWLISFSTFLFLSLAFMKRYSELNQLGDKEDLKERGRGYFVDDIHLLQVMGVVSGYVAAVVFSLYVHSPEVTALYAVPEILWIVVFLFLFWITRIWMITTRGKMTDDPIIFAAKDWVSYLIFIMIFFCFWGAYASSDLPFGFMRGS